MAVNKETGSANRTVVSIICAMAAFVTPFSMTGINVALPTIGKEFALNAVLLTWIVTGNVLAVGIFMVPAGRIADIYGRRKVFIYATALQTVSFITAALAPNNTIFMTARVIQGIATAMSMATYPAILVSVYPPSERGKVLGINTAAVYIGLSMAPFVGGFLTQYFGWRSIFYLCMLFAIIILITATWKIKDEWAEAKGESFDITGSVIFGLALIAIIYGMSLLPAISGILIFIAGLVCLGLFVVWELKVKSPVLDINLFKNSRVFSFSNLAALVNYMATYSISVLLSLYLQYVKGFTPKYTGIILLFQPVVQAIVAPIAGRLSDKVKPQVVSAVGMVFTTIGLIMFSFITTDTPLIYVFISQVVTGLGFGAFASPNTNAIMSSVDKKFYGVASAVTGTMRTVGQTLSLGITTLLFTLYIGHQQITPGPNPAFLQSAHIAFIISAVLCFGGIFASMVSGRTPTVNR
jgi:EmrB/QacA subfamily drug resistance transporter